jgi:hypothetical protein
MNLVFTTWFSSLDFRQPWSFLNVLRNTYSATSGDTNTIPQSFPRGSALSMRIPRETDLCPSSGESGYHCVCEIQNTSPAWELKASHSHVMASPYGRGSRDYIDVLRRNGSLIGDGALPVPVIANIPCLAEGHCVSAAEGNRVTSVDCTW